VICLSITKVQLLGISTVVCRLRSRAPDVVFCDSFVYS